MVEMCASLYGRTLDCVEDLRHKGWALIPEACLSKRTLINNDRGKPEGVPYETSF